MGKQKQEVKPVVSVIIPSYNAEKHIEKCLGSLQQQATALQYEVIVVDSSTDATSTIIREKFPAVKLIHLDQQTYPGAGRNIGVKKARGQIIAFIDSDCAAAENWLEQGVTAIKSGYPLVGGGVINANPGWISWPDYFLTFNEFMPSMPKAEVKFMPTCNFFVTKRAFEEIGGFRGDLLAGEDTLFCYAAAKNYRLLFEPKLPVYHHNRENWEKFLRHHHGFGKHSAYVRKQADIPGKNLVRNPLLALLAPAARISRLSWRMLRHNRCYLPRFVISLPALLAGTVAWSYGFIQEAWRE